MSHGVVPDRVAEGARAARSVRCARPRRHGHLRERGRRSPAASSPSSARGCSRRACRCPALCVLLVGTIADTLDGQVAKAVGGGTRLGAFLDSTFDRRVRRGAVRAARRRSASRTVTPLLLVVGIVALGRVVARPLHPREGRVARRRARASGSRRARRASSLILIGRGGVGLSPGQALIRRRRSLAVALLSSITFVQRVAYVARAPRDSSKGRYRCHQPRSTTTESTRPSRRRARRTRRKRIRVAIIGVGQLRVARWSRASTTTATRSPGRPDPGPHARRPRRLSHPRHRVRRGVRHRQQQGRQGPRARRSTPSRTTPTASPTCRSTGREGPARHDPRRARQVPLRRSSRRRPAPPPTSSRILRDTQGRRRRQLPAGRQRRGDEVVRRADPRSRLRVRQLHPGVHRAASRTGRSASRRRACRSSATTSSRRSARRSPTAC